MGCALHSGGNARSPEVEGSAFLVKHMRVKTKWHYEDNGVLWHESGDEGVAVSGAILRVKALVKWDNGKITGSNDCHLEPISGKTLTKGAKVRATVSVSDGTGRSLYQMGDKGTLQDTPAEELRWLILLDRWKGVDQTPIFMPAEKLMVWHMGAWALVKKLDFDTSILNTYRTGYSFWFVDARYIKESSGPLPKHQELRQKKGCLKQQKIGIDQIINFKLTEFAAISYIWFDVGQPDPDGEQADVLRGWLVNNPHILHVWIDWCCLPQGNRNKAEKEEFCSGRSFVNLVYLSCNVLKIVNSQYMGRFWPQFEAWLSFQTFRATDATFAPDASRSFIAFTGFARDDMDEAKMMKRFIDKRWGKATLHQVLERLDRHEVKVTNAGDKAQQFTKMQQLHRSLEIASR